MSRRDWSLLLLLSAIWGSSYLFIKIGLREMAPAVVVFGRVFAGTIVLLPIALRRGALRGLAARWRVLVVVALVQVAGPFMLIAAGEREISSSLAGILVASAPIFTAILALRYDPEDRSEGLRGAGVAVGIVGVVVLLGFDLSGSGGALLGGFAVVLASLGYAVGGLILKQRLVGHEPLGIAAAVLGISVVAIAPFAAVAAPDAVPGAGPLLAVATLGALGTGCAFAIFYGLIARVGPSRTFVVSYLAPGFAVVYGALLLDEALTAATFAGLVLILGGSFLAAEGRMPWQAPPDPEAFPGPRRRARLPDSGNG